VETQVAFGVGYVFEAHQDVASQDSPETGVVELVCLSEFLCSLPT
jgi:hypothetical protein